MIDSNSFIIQCKKDFIFHKEEQFGGSEEWIVFDPIDLEFYSMNTIAAELFYLIYLGLSKKDSYIKFSEKYDLTFDEFKVLLNEFKIHTYLNI